MKKFIFGFGLALKISSFKLVTSAEVFSCSKPPDIDFQKTPCSYTGKLCNYTDDLNFPIFEAVGLGNGDFIITSKNISALGTSNNSAIGMKARLVGDSGILPVSIVAFDSNSWLASSFMFMKGCFVLEVMVTWIEKLFWGKIVVMHPWCFKASSFIVNSNSICSRDELVDPTSMTARGLWMHSQFSPPFLNDECKFNENLVWRPQSCGLHHMSSIEFRNCLSNRNISILGYTVGDSLGREQLTNMIQFLS